MKTAAKILGIVSILGVLTWVGTYVYWHIRIMGAIRAIGFQPGPRASVYPQDLNPEALQTLMTAGCRSLPYLVREVNSPYHSEAMWNIFCRSYSQALLPQGTTDPQIMAMVKDLNATMFISQDTAEVRREKHHRIKEWWRESGSTYHQWWRVWSADCHR